MVNTKSKCFPIPVVYKYGVLTDLVSWWILATVPLNGPAEINPFIDVALGNTDGCSALKLGRVQCFSAVQCSAVQKRIIHCTSVKFGIMPYTILYIQCSVVQVSAVQ